MFVWIQRLVRDFITLYSLQEVLHDTLSVPLRVVWTGHLHFLCKEKDVQKDDFS